MKFFNTVIIIINTLLFLVAGAIGVCLFFNPELAGNVGSEIKKYVAGSNAPVKISILIFSLFLILIALMTIIGNIEKRRMERNVLLESPMGDIKVSLSAIEDFSKIVKNQVQGVKDIKGKVYSKKNGLKVIAKVTLYSDRAVSDVTQEVQEAIIKYIQYTLGIVAEIKPTVIVNKVVYKEEKGEENE